MGEVGLFSISLARHVRAALGALELIARLPYLMGHFVPAVGADTVATWAGRFGATPETGATPAASAAPAASTSSRTSTHFLSPPYTIMARWCQFG